MPSLQGCRRRETATAEPIMDIADVCAATALQAHVVMPDEGRPPWEAFPDVWGRLWKAEVIWEGRVAMMRQASDASAWYDGGRTMRWQHRTPVWEGDAARGVGDHQRPRRVHTAEGRPR